jgi:hypothetical protein
MGKKQLKPPLQQKGPPDGGPFLFKSQGMPRALP